MNKKFKKRLIKGIIITLIVLGILALIYFSSFDVLQSISGTTSASKGAMGGGSI